MGAFETGALASAEATVKYHPDGFGCLTWIHHLDRGHCLVGSLTGAVASKRVTEARDGSLSLIGNQAPSVMAKESLTVRPTGQAGAKAGHSDLVIPYGRVIT